MGQQTPLHMLASRNTNKEARLQCARLMIAAGADLDKENDGGQSPHAFLQEADDEDKFPELLALLTPS